MNQYDLELELEIYTYEFIDDLVPNIANKMHISRFHRELVEYVTDHIYDIWNNIVYYVEEDEDVDDSDEAYQSMRDFVEHCAEIYFESISTIPARSIPHYETPIKIDVDKIRDRITLLSSIPQPKQRTQEWYEFRHGLITASQIGKLFTSESQYNSLVYEKCKPYEMNQGISRYVNVESTLHWGNKYEPLSILLYEKRYQTKIADFGCIRHEIYDFIGASPDGINVDPHSLKYGRMLEVKNIINRDITGVPLDAYWIQMQIQMETCGLEECDFLETQFKEYADESAFYSDTDTQEKGVLLYFVKKTTIGNLGEDHTNAPHYVFMPLEMALDRESISSWINTTKIEVRSEYTLYATIYWYLEKFSCVLVQRNRTWFKDAVTVIEDAWKTIVKERVSGYDHRMAKKNRNHPVVTQSSGDRQIQNLNINRGICIIKLE